MHFEVKVMDNLVLQYMGFNCASSFAGLSGFNFPTMLEKNSGVWVEKAGARYFPDGFYYTPAINPHWEWGCVLEGSMEICSNEGKYKIQAGDFYVISPDSEVAANPIIKPFLIWFEFNGDKVEDFTVHCNFRNNAITVGKVNPSQAQHVVKIAHLLHEHPNGYELMVHYNLWGFIAYSQITEHMDGFSSEINKAIEHIKKSKGSEKYTLQGLADISGLSVQCFRKQFQQQVGEPPVKYILKMKMKLAKELLSLPEIPVKQIAMEVGIDDPYYFSRLFKKYEGISPELFRKRFYPERY